MKRIGKPEHKYVKQVLNSEFRSSKATSMVTQAEEAFAQAIGVKHAIGFVNGTSTLHIALESLGIGVGDEVIVPPLTMSATAFAVLHANATPVFADVDIKTWQISPNSIKQRLTKNTKAIITVALYGGSPDYDEIIKIAPGIAIIEDNAEAFSTKYKNLNIGSIGEFSSYSFQSSKQLTAGEGGMLCTNSLELADKARKLQSLGYSAVGAKVHKIDKKAIQDPNYLRHEVLGWNYRMSDLTAAVIKGQIERSRSLLEIRIKTGEAIFNLARKSNGLLIPQEIYGNSTHSFWAAPIILDINQVAWNEFRDKYLEFGGKGIYAAWQLSFLEPVFLNQNFLGRGLNLDGNRFVDNQFCENARYIQPRILAFRTNEWKANELKSQLKALQRTIDFFKQSRL